MLSLLLTSMICSEGASPALALSSKQKIDPAPTVPQQKKQDNKIIRVVPTDLVTTRLSFAPIVKKVSPGVVSIYTQQEDHQQSHHFFDDDFLHFFFGNGVHQKKGGNRSHSTNPQKAQSMGSGVIVDKQGIIITCAHVVQNGKNIKVKLSDNREFSATVAILDRNLDLAVLKIDDKDLHPNEELPFIPLGKSGDLQVGDLVLAVGNPFGVGQSVTNGIISALSRNVNGRILIQTDAPINPGNSGGALVDSEGELIAIPNAILSKTGGSHGIGFAIPSSILRPLIKAAQTGEKVRHPWDGLLLQTLTPDKAESFGMKDGRGAFVARLQEGSPAIQAGIKMGDVIREVNGLPIDTAEDYVIKMQDVEIGSPVSLKLFTRNGDKDVSFTLGIPPRVPEPNETVLSGKHLLTGVKIANLSPALAIENGFPLDKYGVVIISLEEAPYAGMLGLEPGDIIARINNTKIGSVDELKKATGNTYKDVVIHRGNQEFRITSR